MPGAVTTSTPSAEMVGPKIVNKASFISTTPLSCLGPLILNYRVVIDPIGGKED